MKIKNIIGNAFVILGYLSFLIFGAWGMLITARILIDIGGFLLLVVGLMVAPVILAAAPLYAAVALNTFFPFIIIFGGGILSLFLIGIGGWISR